MQKLTMLDYPKSSPPQTFHVEPEAIQTAQGLALKELIETNAGETAIDSFLRDNPALLAACMNFTQFGHHGTWVVPQQEVRPPSLPEIRGLKPDYLVGGKGSRGYSWYVVELKSPSDKMLLETKLAVFLSAVSPIMESVSCFNTSIIAPQHSPTCETL